MDSPKIEVEPRNRMRVDAASRKEVQGEQHVDKALQRTILMVIIANITSCHPQVLPG